MNVYKKLNLARETFHKSKLQKTGHNKLPTTTILSWGIL